MTTLVYSNLDSGDYPFDPAVDVLQIDGGLSAADLTVKFTTKVTFVGGGRTISLLTNPATLSTANVTFGDGSVLLVGDNTPATANDTLGNFLLGSSLGDQLWGLEGDDELYGATGGDSLSGGEGADTLTGGGGGDRLNGGAHADVMVGGGGHDHYLVDSMSDVVTELAGEGVDLVRSSVTIAALFDHVENATLIGTANVDLMGNDLANKLSGNSGDNAIAGLGGDDSLYGASGTDTLVGGGGRDTLIGRGLLSGGGGDDSMVGGGTSNGGDGDDTLRGGGTLNGEGGADVIQYSPGSRTNGGAGADTLVLSGADLRDARITGIDIIAFSSAITLDALSIQEMSDTGEVRITGDGTVAVEDVWTRLSPVEIDGISYGRYASGDSTLLVQSGVRAIAAATSIEDLEAGEGFIVTGAGSPVAAGDFDGDGFADLFIGDQGFDGGATNRGAAYVVFGQSADRTGVDLSSLGAGGLRMEGEQAGDEMGSALSTAGDVNGDGLTDMIVGARSADPHGSFSGATYVVFGTAARTEPDLAALDGENGFQISGVAASDLSGHSVASAGDTNGDGFADLVVAAPYAGPDSAGVAYVIFGASSGFSSNLDLSAIDGSNGFRVRDASQEYFPWRVSGGGDMNGDGFDDVIVAGLSTDMYGEATGYVLFGDPSGFSALLNLSSLDGNDGFAFEGGDSASNAGDINGDGFDDLVVWDMIGTYHYAVIGGAYVVFGDAGGFPAFVDPSTLDGQNGFRLRLPGTGEDGLSRALASAGDFNGDGFDDVLVAAESGAYIVFGKASGFSETIDVTKLGNACHVAGSGAFVTACAAGDLNGDGFDDVLLGSSTAAKTYVLYGSALSGVVDVTASEQADILLGTAGADNISALAGADVLKGGAGADSIFGGAGGDRLEGDAGDDRLNGASGLDRISGDDGDDRLDGGLGRDTLDGGIGDDTFVFNDALRSNNVDRIMDFGGAGAFAMDVIHLDSVQFSALSPGALSAEHLVAGTDPVAMEEDDYILYDRGTGALYYDADANGAGAPIMFAVLANDPNGLDASDFVVT